MNHVQVVFVLAQAKWAVMKEIPDITWETELRS